jgi:hypothetical protein
LSSRAAKREGSAFGFTPEKAPGPRDFFLSGVRVAPVAGALGYKSARTHTTFWGARQRAQKHNVWGTRKTKMLG